MTIDRPKVRMTEVGPRDGLQNESVRIPTAIKIQFVDQLSAAGFPEIEVTSFVSAKWVPQLGDASEVMRGITRRAGTIYSALVPNDRGLDDALEARVDKVSVFVSATEGFSKHNTNGSVDEVLARIGPVVSRARTSGKSVRGYVSCIIRCPYDGPVDPAQVVAVCARLLEMGVDEIDLGDTIGVADADSISRLYQAIARIIEPSKTTLHLHDTHGQAITCALRALEIGVRSFDSSVAGLGGCPYAPGSAGNVATETLARAMVSAGFDTNIDIQRVSDAGLWMRQQLALSRAASS